MDRFLFGFPDFLFYFKIACEKFNLHKKVIKFTGTVSHNIDWEIIQPYELEEGRDVPIWWTNYNKLKHYKIKNFDICTLGDLIKSMSGAYILMNYLLKYQENNFSIPNRNYFSERENGMVVGNCKFCSFQSKLFVASHAYQSPVYTIVLPSHLSTNEYENSTLREVQVKYYGGNFDVLVPYEQYKINDLNLQSTEHTLGREITNKNSMFHSVQHALFFTYLDYVEVHHQQAGLLRELKHFGRFIN